jgi:hypothetical protein
MRSYLLHHRQKGLLVVDFKTNPVIDKNDLDQQVRPLFLVNHVVRLLQALETRIDKVLMFNNLSLVKRSLRSQVGVVFLIVHHVEALVLFSLDVVDILLSWPLINVLGVCVGQGRAKNACETWVLD